MYVGTGNAEPWPQALRTKTVSTGLDNLYVASIVAVDVDNGELKWHYQMVPGDQWDYDSVQQMILADLNIAERRIPQDGRIKLKMGERVIDFRVSTLPTLYGEKIVLRILDVGRVALDLEELGLGERGLAGLTHSIASPFGILLVTGPTGSGKTTTLYSALSRLNQPGVNIMTAENPVEYNLKGVNQLQVREARKARVRARGG